MNEVRRIRVKTNELREHKDMFRVKGLEISKSYIIKTDIQNFYNHQRLISWTNIYLDPDFFRQQGIPMKLREIKDLRLLFVYGRKSYGIIWAKVIDRMYSRPLNLCFFCDVELVKGVGPTGKTKDHLIPSVMIEAYGLRYIDDNILPCCKECNSEKSSLHPYTFREKVKNKLKFSKLKKWKTVLQVLNKILIEKKDPLR